MIIACVIWGIINGYTSQRATYRAVCSVLFPNGDFPSRSRFTRLSSNLAYTIKIIRYFFIKKLTKGELVGISIFYTYDELTKLFVFCHIKKWRS
ncbi:hypothetical protein EfmJHP38_05300 [Enterococcus faecium]|nr:hypothetical protein EfmJHP38_05300 [Enterococcus faecium]